MLMENGVENKFQFTRGAARGLDACYVITPTNIDRLRKTMDEAPA